MEQNRRVLVAMSGGVDSSAKYRQQGQRKGQRQRRGHPAAQPVQQGAQAQHTHGDKHVQHDGQALLAAWRQFFLARLYDGVYWYSF